MSPESLRLVEKTAPQPEVKTEPTPEPAATPKSETASSRHSRELFSSFNTENQSFFSKMSEGGKQFASDVYEGMYAVPGVSRAAAKIENGYNKAWIRRHETKAAKYADQVKLKDNAIGQHEILSRKLQLQIDTLNKQNLPTGQLELQMRKLEEQRAKMLNKRDKLQTKFEKRENKVKIYTAERDRVADKLIDRFEAALKPMEQKIEAAQTERSRMELKAAVMEAKHAQAREKLTGEEAELAELKDALRLSGLSERKVNKMEAVRILQTAIDGAYAVLDTERKALAQDLRDNDRYMADLDKHANPLRDKRERYVRDKQIRPRDFKIAARKREWNPDGRDATNTHSRTESTERPIREAPAEAPEAAAETEEDRERPKLNVYLAAWRAFMVEKLGGEDKLSPQERTQGMDDVIKTIGADKDFRMDRNAFKKVLGAYYKLKKLPMDAYHKYIDEFLEQEEITLPKRRL